MKTILKVSLFAIAAFALASCAPPANTNTNTNTNTNANAAPRTTAPSVDTLMALDTKAWDAYKAKDGKFFETFIADNFVSFEDGKRPTRAEVIKMISENKCDIKSHSLSEGHVTPVSADVAVLTYKGTGEGTCDGKPMPSPVTAVTVFVRSGTEWKAAYHNEVAVVTPPPTGGNSNASAPASNSTAPASTNTAPASNAASNSNTTAPSTGDALTDAIMAVEKRGWEAWMKQDAKGLEETTHKDLSFVDIMGKATHGQANVIKGWTDGSCKVSSVDVSDGKATQIANNVAILTFKGTAVGTCNGAKLEPLWGTTVAVKDGDKWKAVYIFETPMRKG
jgi:ketosteroid isomerase-like protein